MNKNNRIIIASLMLVGIFLFQIYGIYSSKDSGEQQIKTLERFRENISAEGLTKGQASVISSAITEVKSSIEYQLGLQAIMSAFFTTMSCLVVLSVFYSKKDKDIENN